MRTADPSKVHHWDEDVDSPSERLQSTTTYQNNDVYTTDFTTTVEMNSITEFDYSPEAALLRKCDAADSTGWIPDCVGWVRKIKTVGS